METNTLTELGFSPNEGRVYLCLVENGKLAANTIAKRLKLPRSTIYSVLAILEERGLIRRDLVRGCTLFRVDNPEDLLQLIVREEKEIAQRKVIAKRFVEELRPLFRSKSYRAPRLEFYEGKDRVEKFLFDSLPLWAESILANDKSTWGYQDHTFVSEFGPWIKECWKVLHVDNKIPGRILSNPSDVERKLRGKIPGREVRVLGKEFDFKSSIWVMGDYVVLILTRETPIVAFQIHNKTLSGNLRLLFRFLYEQASAEV